LLSVLVALAVAATPPAPQRLEGFSSLRIAPGVREAGMGGVGVASGFGPQAMAWNPAAVASVRGFAATACYTKWFLDTHHQSFFAARSLGFINLGAGVVSFSAGTFEYRVKPTEEPLGTFVPADFTFYLNVSRSIGRLLQFGITGRHFYSKIMDNSARGIGGDFGLRVLPFRGFTVGASIVDFGKTMSYKREVFWLPTRARLGASYDFAPLKDTRITPAVDGSYFIYGKQFDVQSGLEFVWHEMAAVRAGYDFLSEANPLSFGAGVRLKDFRLDYSLSPLGYDLGVAHRFSIGIGR
jgi:hypothetical protein